MSDQIKTLKQLSNGDDVLLTIDGEYYEAWVAGRDYDPAERDRWGPIKGSLSIHLELSESTVERHQLATHVVNIRVVEIRKGEWSDPIITVGDPVYEDGEVIEVEYHSLGELQDITLVED